MAGRVVLIFGKRKAPGLRRIGATGKWRMAHLRDLPVVQQVCQSIARGGVRRIGSDWKRLG